MVTVGEMVAGCPEGASKGSQAGANVLLLVGGLPKQGVLGLRGNLACFLRDGVLRVMKNSLAALFSFL